MKISELTVNYRRIFIKTRLILKPGQKGTKRLTDKYGDALVCIRFRYDAESRQRLKTVELIVEKADWTPPAPKYSADISGGVLLFGAP